MPGVEGAAVVVVDQWALVRVGIATVLQGAGARVVAEEASARDGLLRARTLGADLVVLGAAGDLPMPEAVRQAVALPQHPKVLVLVSALGPDEAPALMAEGPDGVLLRSAGADELADAVRRLEKGERVVSPALVPVVMEALTSGFGGAPEEGPLTSKEREVLARLAEGRSNQEIAEALFVTSSTVKTHLAHIYAKLGVKGRHEALARAVALGLLG
jgi:NarL family two-component system response regulator LiaR